MNLLKASLSRILIRLAFKAVAILIFREAERRGKPWAKELAELIESIAARNEFDSGPGNWVNRKTYL